MADYRNDFIEFIKEFFPEEAEKLNDTHYDIVSKFMEHRKEQLLIVGGRRLGGIVIAMPPTLTASQIALFKKEFDDDQKKIAELSARLIPEPSPRDRLDKIMEDLDIPKLTHDYLPDNDVPGNKTNSIITHPHKKDYFLEQKRLQHKHARRRK